MTAATPDNYDDIEITPLVLGLSGVISVDADYDYKRDYTVYILEKYK